jgi:hypothetical protein
VGTVVTVEPVPAAARAGPAVVPAKPWAREMARDRLREAFEAAVGPPAEPERPKDWAVRVGWRDPP